MYCGFYWGHLLTESLQIMHFFSRLVCRRLFMPSVLPLVHATWRLKSCVLPFRFVEVAGWAGWNEIGPQTSANVRNSCMFASCDPKGKPLEEHKVAFGLEVLRLWNPIPRMAKGQRDENSGQATGTRNLWANFFHSNLHSSALSQGCVAVYSKVVLDLQSVSMCSHSNEHVAMTDA